jgi:hypothetical protein
VPYGVELIDVTGEIKSRRVDDTYVGDSDTYAIPLLRQTLLRKP